MASGSRVQDRLKQLQGLNYQLPDQSGRPSLPKPLNKLAPPSPGNSASLQRSAKPPPISPGSKTLPHQNPLIPKSNKFAPQLPSGPPPNFRPTSAGATTSSRKKGLPPTPISIYQEPENEEYSSVPDDEPQFPQRMHNGRVSLRSPVTEDAQIPQESDIDKELRQQHSPMQSPTRNASRAGFGSHMQNKVAHETLMKLNSEEIKLVMELKKLIVSRAKADKDYAVALANIHSTAAKFESDFLTSSESLVHKAWKTMVQETESVSQIIKKNSEAINVSLKDKVDLLIQEKTKGSKQYQQERLKVDDDFKKAQMETRDAFNRYQKCSKEARESRQKYDEICQKGKKVKDVEKAKEIFKKAVVKQHQAHNEYVLSLRSTSTHQEHYRATILPKLLDSLQQTQENHVVLIKHILSELSSFTNSASADFIASHNAIIQDVNGIRIDMEYSTFLEVYRVDQDPVDAIEFDYTAMQDFPDNLIDNAVVMDNLTLETLQHTCTSLFEQYSSLEAEVQQKQQELANLDEEIRNIPPSVQSETAVLDLLSKQKDYRDLSREINNLECRLGKITEQYQIVYQETNEINEDNIPPGLDIDNEPLMSPPPMQPQSQRSRTLPPTPGDFQQQPPLPDSRPPLTPPTMDNKFGSNLTGKFTSKIGIFKSKSENKDIPLEEEKWYHGALPRQETEEVLKNNGDFLVRERSDASGQYVLSTRAADKTKHFPIVFVPETKKFRLEGQGFNTVQELVYDHLQTGLPVTKASNAVLRNGVVKVKDVHDLKHEDIVLGKKLGSGHFGDVFEGKLKNHTPIAIKTCKATVDAPTRRKFLSEANILKGYNHPNIVKLIGVATDKHPIYIVMELISGGDLLSFLRDDRQTLTVKDRVKMSEESASGMAYLEQKGCIHRDLAARNCLVGNKNSIKISDFGMSREEEEYTIESNNMRQIPIKWTAPEAMNYGKYTSQSDVWSYGILLWEIFSHGSTPYPGMNNNETREKVDGGYRMQAPQQMPHEINTIMENCWEEQPEHRPRFAEIKASLTRIKRTIKN